MPIDKTTMVSYMCMFFISTVTLFTFCVVNVSNDHAAAFYIIMIEHLCSIALFGMGMALLRAAMDSLVGYWAHCHGNSSREAENLLLACAAVAIKLTRAEMSMDELVMHLTEKMATHTTAAIDEVKCKNETSPASSNTQEAHAEMSMNIKKMVPVSFNDVKCKDEIFPASESSSTRSSATTASD